MKGGHRALILGQNYEACGYDDQARLILGNGERFEIVPIGVDAGTFRSYTLRAVSQLSYTGGEWMVDGVPLETYCARQFHSPRTSESDTKLFTAWALRDALEESRPEWLNSEYPPLLELRKKATAVAWVEELYEDYPGQTRDPNEKPRQIRFQGETINMLTEESPPAKAFRPIFLSSFYRIQSLSNTEPVSAEPPLAPHLIQKDVQTDFSYDVFLSHSSKDKAVVRPLAERLRKDGLKVWLDEWEIKPGDNIPSKIEGGLEHSRVLVLCMSAHAFGSDWAQLEAGTFRFRDPLNKQRRFIPLRLDDAPIKGSLAQFLYIDWLAVDREAEYAKLLAACKRPATWPKASAPIETESSTLERLRSIARTAGQEWRRIRDDFESRAQKYPNLKLKVLCVHPKDAIRVEDGGQPNHMINLWQYFGSGEEPRKRLASSEFNKFGAMGAEISAYGIVLGPETDLFCRMASRAGSLLPDDIHDKILDNVTKYYDKSGGAGGPILVANRNPLAKWLNVVLMATVHAFPQRIESGVMAIDPFAASLTVFDLSLSPPESKHP